MVNSIKSSSSTQLALKERRKPGVLFSPLNVVFTDKQGHKSTHQFSGFDFLICCNILCSPSPGS